MNKRTAVLLIVLFCVFSAGAQTVLKNGQRITKSIQVRKGVYRLTAPDSLDRGAIIIEGNNIVVDFAGAELRGSADSVLPNQFRGVAVQVRNGRNVTIRNLRARGYQVALLARNVEGLTLENCDLSYNYRQRLRSTQEKEDLADWMSYHRNETDQWLRYGAGIYLRGCNGFTVRNCTVTGGQNALMLMECNSGRVYNNDFSFNSGIGIGLYRSSGNTIVYNKVNFNVRGYSHGIYNRGQDSAGFLVYEQSSGNLFAHNSATHSGDGFFLWAGQTTMDTGVGGCNDNQITDSDFSYAPTNGVEATFSRNIIARNRIFECDHGIWGGYSYETQISSNQFRNNRIAIAIEHGQRNAIDYNIFFRDQEAIRLWAREQQPADWGYARTRDTRSADYLIYSNSFNQVPLVYNIRRTDSLNIFGNAYVGAGAVWKIDSTVQHLDSSGLERGDTTAVELDIPNRIDPFKGGGRLAGRKNIRMTEWGPYNYRYPLIWLANPKDSSDTLRFEVLGPKGRWKIRSARGLDSLRVSADSFPSAFRARRQKGARVDIELVAEYRGPAFTDAFGKEVRANTPHLFRFRTFFQPIDFHVKWYGFDSLTNPIRMGNLAVITRDTPLLQQRTDRLDYAWWGGIKSGGRSHSRFLTIAEGSFQTPAGSYALDVTWDDAVRIWVDGKLVLDEWNPSRYAFDESPHRTVPLPLRAGVHSVRVEHVELGGFAALSLRLNKL